MRLSQKQKDRPKGVKTKSAESVNRNRENWRLTFSIKIARRMAGRNSIYRLPNGVYAVRKKKR